MLLLAAAFPVFVYLLYGQWAEDFYEARSPRWDAACQSNKLRPSLRRLVSSPVSFFRSLQRPSLAGFAGAPAKRAPSRAHMRSLRALPNMSFSIKVPGRTDNPARMKGDVAAELDMDHV
eukprot:gene7174-9697_t